MGTRNSWEESWFSGPNGPLLIPDKHFSTTVTHRLEKVVREAAWLWETQRAALAKTHPEVSYAPPSDLADWHHYNADLKHELPLNAWSVDRGAVHSALVSMRNDLFRELLANSGGWTDKQLKKKVEHRDWPNSLSASEWKDTRAELGFVSDVILDRIEITQPFRDRNPGGTPATKDWMRQGGVQSSRRAANEDKHEGTVSVAVNLVNPCASSNYDFTIVDIDTRDHRSAPGDDKPLISIQTDAERPNPLSVDHVVARLVVPNRSQETRQEQPWTPANRDLWHQVIENIWVLHTVQAGVEIARNLTQALVEQFIDFWDRGDMIYEASGDGWSVPADTPNPFQRLHEELHVYQEHIRSLAED